MFMNMRQITSTSLKLQRDTEFNMLLLPWYFLLTSLDLSGFHPGLHELFSDIKLSPRLCTDILDTATGAVNTAQSKV